LLNSLWATEQIAPISDFFPPSFIDGFAAATLPGASRDEVLWGLPDTAGLQLLLFYNTRLVDTPPTNLDELGDIAQNLRGGQRWGLGVNSYDPLWLVPWLSAYGGWLTDEQGQPTLNTAAMVSALILQQSWHDGDEAIAPLATYQEMREQFLAGNIGLMIDGEWAIGELVQTEEVEWAVAPLPTLGEADDLQPPAPLILGRYWAISRNVKGDEALGAATFLEFITRPERQLAWTARYGLLPTRREALNTPTIANDPHLRPSAMQLLAGRAVPVGVDANRLLEAMRESLGQVLAGELSPAEAAELMQKKVE
jgi:arabinogalactan oligomer/maltooligosaccharide transport system substrate-binding protein